LPGIWFRPVTPFRGPPGPKKGEKIRGPKGLAQKNREGFFGQVPLSLTQHQKSLYRCGLEGQRVRSKAPRVLFWNGSVFPQGKKLFGISPVFGLIRKKALYQKKPRGGAYSLLSESGPLTALLPRPAARGNLTRLHRKRFRPPES